MSMENIRKHLSILGYKVEDRVTGLKGTVTSVSFDLYGCVQVIVNTGMNKDGKMGEQIWLDIARVKITSVERVMPLPEFVNGPDVVSEGRKGPAEKPQGFHAA